MKAVVQERYGSADKGLSIRDLDTPMPKHDDVLVSVTRCRAAITRCPIGRWRLAK